MPISFTQVTSAGDPLPNNRAVLYFPSIPEVLDGSDLMLRHTVVSMPPMQIGHIIIKQLGWSLAFAGLRTQQNNFNVEFVETIDAPVVKTLTRWQDICAGFQTHVAKLKSDYAVNCQCVAYDSTGTSALVTTLYNVWPMTVNYGQYSEDTGPSMVNVDFSVDCIDIEDVIFNERDFEFATQTAGTPPLWYSSNNLGNSNRQAGINMGSFNVSQNVVSQLGLTSLNVGTILGGYF